MPLEVFVEKEPITVILSQKGWIRCIKGHAALDDDFKFKDDDALQIALHAQTTDRIIFLTLQESSLRFRLPKFPAAAGSVSRCV